MRYFMRYLMKEDSISRQHRVASGQKAASRRAASRRQRAEGSEQKQSLEIEPLSAF
jgi:hypothetical protein